ncbi:hypothetical protein NP233_g9782 [Leucocoprinus birnbaumii]|uniref:Uncharacterized protein n=1 Tax=Leucocoprinus birnbaumii TaxID=56174 RepID=A0AAD5VJK6_9AGAR|nr:hypothetical protein NP233_g9782 [Leucocoprinus birnbaumii]
MGAARHANAYNIKFGLKRKSHAMIDYIKGWFRAPGDKKNTPDLAWTLTHGFLLEMQGMIFLKDGQPLSRPVTSQSRSHISSLRRHGQNEEATKLQKLCDLEELRSSFHPGVFLHLAQLSGPINIPSEDEINDKSKSDFFSKLIVVTQTTWFIVQCMTRWLQNLPVTELEVITLAFAFLNFVTYTLWWNKPQNLRVAFPVCEASEAYETYKQRTGDRSQEVEESVTGQGSNSSPSRHSQTSLAQPIVQQDQQFHAHPHTHILIRVSVKLYSTLLVAIRVPFQVFHMLLTAINPLPAYFIMIGDNFLGLGSPDIQASFYSFIGGTEEEKFVSFGLGSVGILFGGTHLLPFWLSSFPSDHARWLWMTSASWLLVESTLVSFAIPISNRLPFMLECLFVPLIFLSHIIGFLVYAVARFILIYVALSNLRSSPPNVFRNIEWSTFVPHF